MQGLARTARQGGSRGECRAVRASKPHRSARRIEGGTTEQKIRLSLIEKKFRGARKRKNVRRIFCEAAAVAIAEAGGGAGAYDFVQNHHVLRACVSVGFGNRCELGKIKTPEQNLSVFGGLFLWRREAPTMCFAPFLIHFLARKRVVCCISLLLLTSIKQNSPP